jgi:hypothetical protein
MYKRIEVVILIVLLAFLMMMSFVFNFNGLYGQDPYEYKFFAETLRSFWSGEVNDLPHFYFPFLYPAFGALLSFFGLSVSFALQLVSAISLWFIFILIQRILTRFFNADRFPAFVFSALFLLLCPYLVRFSVLVMSDLFAIALFLVTFYFFLSLREKADIRNTALFSLFCALVIQARYAFFPLVIVFLVLSLVLLLKNKTWMLMLILAASFFIASLPEFLFRGRFLVFDMMENTSAYALQADFWSFHHFFQSEFVNPDGVQSYQFPNSVQNLIWFFHPAFFIFALPLFFFFKKSDLNKSWYLVLYVFILYFIFISGLTYQNKRYLLIGIPLMTILFYPAWINFWSRIQKLRMLLLVLIPIQFVLIYFALQPVLKMNKEDKPLIHKESAQ